MVQDSPLSYLEDQIYNFHEKLIALSSEKVEQEYLSSSMSLQTFGCTMFSVSGSGEKLGIAEDGILVRKKVLGMPFLFFSISL